MTTTIMTYELPAELAHLDDKTKEVLSRYPNAADSLAKYINSPSFPGNTLINTFEYFADEIPVHAVVDGVTTLVVEAPDNLSYEVCEMAINGEIALVKIGDEIPLNRIDLIAKYNTEFRKKLMSF